MLARDTCEGQSGILAENVLAAQAWLEAHPVHPKYLPALVAGRLRGSHRASLRVARFSVCLSVWSTAPHTRTRERERVCLSAGPEVSEVRFAACQVGQGPRGWGWVGRCQGVRNVVAARGRKPGLRSAGRARACQAAAHRTRRCIRHTAQRSGCYRALLAAQRRTRGIGTGRTSDRQSSCRFQTRAQSAESAQQRREPHVSPTCSEHPKFTWSQSDLPFCCVTNLFGTAVGKKGKSDFFF